MSDASISLGLNASEMYGELKNAESRFSGGMDRMGQSTGRLTGLQSKFLEGNNRVTNQVQGFARSLLYANSGADVLAAGLDRLENSTKLTLGGGLALAAGAVIVQKIADVRKEYQALAADLKNVHDEASKSGDFQTLSQLEAAAGRADAAIAKLEDRVKARSGGWRAKTMQWIKDQAGSTDGGGGDYAGQDKAELAKTYGDIDKNIADKIGKSRKLSDLREDSLGGEADHLNKARRLEIESMERAGKTIDEFAQVMRELDLSFREIAAGVASKRRERVQQSLGEIAGRPEVATNEMSYDYWNQGELARKAQGWDAEAERRRGVGDMTGAQEAFNYSNDIKRSIPGLKDSEKDLKGEFRGALEEAKILQEIRDAAKERAVGKS